MGKSNHRIISYLGVTARTWRYFINASRIETHWPSPVDCQRRPDQTVIGIAEVHSMITTP